MTIAELIVRHLRDAGVRFLFGMPGGGSNLDLLDAAGRAGLPFVLAATETAGAIAAIAQAEITGRPGACLTTLGPGVTSVVNGAACALLERAPLIVFSDSHPASAAALEHQRIDHRAVLGPVTKWSAALSPENAEDVLVEAIARSMAEPRGPVHIDCPADVLSRTVIGRAFHPSTSPVGRLLSDPANPTCGSTERLQVRQHDKNLIAAARRPLLLVGLGARDVATARAIRALCASRSIPAMVTYKAKGVVPDDDPHFAGIFTNGALERPMLEEADLLIGIGLDPVELIPRPWTYAQPIINVDLAVLERCLPGSDWDLPAVRARVEAQRQSLCPPTDRLSAHRVVQIAAAACAGSARVTVDAGAHMFPGTMLWPIGEPNGMLISNGLSTMGFALPAAIGAALMERDREPDKVGSHGPATAGRYGAAKPVVALIGDGGLLMCAGELLTAVRERLQVIVIVFNDRSLSLIDIKQQQRGHAASGVSLGEVRWRQVAEGFGAATYAVSTETDLERALAAALAHCGPTLIDAQIDAATYPATLSAIRG